MQLSRRGLAARDHPVYCRSGAPSLGYETSTSQIHALMKVIFNPRVTEVFRIWNYLPRTALTSAECMLFRLVDILAEGTSERVYLGLAIGNLKHYKRKGTVQTSGQPIGSHRRFFRPLVWLILAIVIVSSIGISAVVFYHPQLRNPQCAGVAACFQDSVSYIVDGDILDVGSTRIRLTLVNTPEVGEPGYSEAKQSTSQTCPVGTQALVDEDDGQTGGSYGRMIAVVYCQGVNLNAELLTSGHAVLLSYYCSVSEFADQAWTGCP